jgi:glycosyltransferase involved in cell wall biosynthesis
LSFLPDNLDVERLRQDGKAVYFHFRGCFILSTFLMDRVTRDGGTIASACAECKQRGWRDRYFDRFYRAVTFAHRVFVSTPNLCHCSPAFEYVPHSLPPELAHVPAIVPRVGGGPVRVLHCVTGPGHYAVKGTEHVRRAVRALQEEGLAVELDIIEQMSRAEAVERFRDGDLLVEQLNLGAYGNVAIEAMAHGLPVISSLDPSVAHLIPNCPIVHATPVTIIDRLRELVLDAKLRQDLGRRCYRFVREFHDNDRIAAHLTAIYHVDLGLERARPKNTLANRRPSYA